eukprot:scaffold3096_cov138-Skeletonema_menzelii.AAC.2
MMAASYHRGDPLDIPLIDHHLLVHMLCPRITSAIRYAFPQLYLDWTTGVIAADNDSASHYNNPFIRKRWVEMLLHTSLIVGSCHFRSNSNAKETSVHVETPAMKSLGMMLRPVIIDSNNNHQPRPSKIKVYSKIVALVLATVIVPALYEELKLRRQKQLERQETQLRLAQLHQEFQTSNSNTAVGEQNQNTARQQQHHRHDGNLVQQRALRRKTLIQRLLVDSILGMSDILIPPLRLITYVSYLWGLCPTPNLGNSMIGWEYASVNNVFQGNSSEGDSLSILPQNQRHANFQYGNRRLMVEEGLRTMAAILPPRSNSNVQPPEGDNRRNRRSADNASNNEDDRLSTNATTSQILPRRGRRGWMRQRALSFMGVVEDQEEEPEQQQHELNCSLCQTVSSIPYITSCGHYYCYICLRIAVTEDPYYRCVCCRKRVESSSRPKIKSPFA